MANDWAHKMRKIERHLFPPMHENPDYLPVLTEDESALSLVIRDVYTHWITVPSASDNDIAAYITNNYPSYSSVERLRLIAQIKIILGNVSLGAKKFHQYRAIQMALNCYNAAEVSGDMKGMNAALQNFIKATGIDRDEEDNNAEAMILPDVIVVTDDATVAGGRKIKGLDTVLARIRKKYYKTKELQADDREEILP